MMRLVPLTLLVALLVGAPVRGQYYYPAPPQPMAAGPVYSGDSGRFPRLRRGLQVVADPTVVFSPPSRFYSGNAPTAYPVLGAAPNLVTLATLGMTSGISLGLPPALRLTRVILVGPPQYVRTRRETLLWVASPIVLYAVRARRGTLGR